MAPSPRALPIAARPALPLAAPAAGPRTEAGSLPGPRCPR